MDSKTEFWVGHSRYGVTILERSYNTLEEAKNDYAFSGKFGAAGWVIVETDDPDQWERDNNLDGISFNNSLGHKQAV